MLDAYASQNVGQGTAYARVLDDPVSSAVCGFLCLELSCPSRSRPLIPIMARFRQAIAGVLRGPGCHHFAHE
jgi:hypothetical protein